MPDEIQSVTAAEPTEEEEPIDLGFDEEEPKVKVLDQPPEPDKDDGDKARAE